MEKCGCLSSIVLKALLVNGGHNDSAMWHGRMAFDHRKTHAIDKLIILVRLHRLKYIICMSKILCFSNIVQYGTGFDTSNNGHAGGLEIVSGTLSGAETCPRDPLNKWM